jgi:hypothetical protein
MDGSKCMTHDCDCCPYYFSCDCSPVGEDKE